MQEHVRVRFWLEVPTDGASFGADGHKSVVVRQGLMSQDRVHVKLFYKITLQFFDFYSFLSLQDQCENRKPQGDGGSTSRSSVAVGVKPGLGWLHLVRALPHTTDEVRLSRGSVMADLVKPQKNATVEVPVTCSIEQGRSVALFFWGKCMPIEEPLLHRSTCSLSFWDWRCAPQGAVWAMYLQACAGLSHGIGNAGMCDNMGVSIYGGTQWMVYNGKYH